MNQPHRIRTLRFDLRAASPETAFRLRQVVAASVQSAGFTQGFEILLDRLAPDGTEYRIERLEVPMAGLTAEAWEREGTAQVLAALETALTRELRRATPTTKERGIFSANEAVPAVPAHTASPGTWLDAFVQFLETGRRPWWAGADVFSEETARAELLRQPPEPLRARLAAVLAQVGAARRLVWQVEPEVVFALLEHLSGTATVGRIREHETERVRGFRTQKRPAGTLRDTLETNRATWVQRLADRAWQADAAWLEAEILRLDEADGVRSTAGSGTSPADFNPAGLDSTPAPEIPPVQPPPTTQQTSGTATGNVPNQDFSEEKNARLTTERAVFSKNETHFFVANAGLVLLHPFIAPLLAELNFLENGRFRSEKHHHRAVHLLAHLVGQGAFPAESELLLPKLLLGLPPGAPMRRRVRLSRTEKAEVRNLLLAVIEHWSVLKTTSPEALQAEFLQREGRLERRDADWHLTVEQRTSDVLLGHLPWGISMVRLPWMTDWLAIAWV